MKKQEKQHYASIIDIANRLKISAATVSRVLNNYPYVKEDTRKKVLELVEEMGFQKNGIASSLRSRKTYCIGLIVPRISMVFHSSIITVIQNELYERGYNLMICQSNDSADIESKLLDTFIAARVDAVIIAATLTTVEIKSLQKLTESNIPVVFYDRVPKGIEKALVVRGDDFQGGYLAGSHLAEVGCKNIAVIMGLLSSNIYEDRLNGFREALRQHNLKIKPEWMFLQELTVENARSALYKIFSSKSIPDGLFAANDTTAITTVEFLKERNIAVPGQVKVMGYSNDPRTSIITPAITTIEQMPERFGVSIVNELMSVLDKKEAKHGTKNGQSPVIIPVQLIRRMST